MQNENKNFENLSLEDPFGAEPARFRSRRMARREEQSRARRGELMRGLIKIGSRGF